MAEKTLRGGGSVWQLLSYRKINSWGYAYFITQTAILCFSYPPILKLCLFLNVINSATMSAVITTVVLTGERLVIFLPTLSGLLRVWEALSLKLNWLVIFGSFLSVLEAALSGLSSSPASSTSPPSSTGVACGKPTRGSVNLLTLWGHRILFRMEYTVHHKVLLWF